MYEWELGMGGISEISEDYEKSCRCIFKAGMDWFDRNPKANPLFTRNSSVIYTDNESARELQTVMVQSCIGCTGAMFRVCLSHILHAHKVGWVQYVEEMSTR
jgi:hypothetical protein